MQEHIAEFTGVNEAFEVIFNAAGAENMNRVKVSHCNISRFAIEQIKVHYA